jgi:RNA recognition motif-containing protein
LRFISNFKDQKIDHSSDKVTNNNKGFAMIEFISEDALRAALKFNKTKFMDRYLVVDVKEEKKVTSFNTPTDQVKKLHFDVNTHLLKQIH